MTAVTDGDTISPAQLIGVLTDWITGIDKNIILEKKSRRQNFNMI